MAHPELELVAQLRALAGVKNEDRFEVHHGDAIVRVAYSGGSSSSLTLIVPYDRHARAATPGGYRGGGPLAAIRPLRVKLTPETAANLASKQAGIDAEFQSGDPAFDARVYVDTQTPPEVLAAVLNTEARAAIVELLDLAFNRVELDDVERQLTATMVTFPSRTPPEPTAARIVDAFARLALAMPRLRELEGKHAPHPLAGVNTALGVLALLNVIGGGPLYFLVTMRGRCEDDSGIECVGPGLVGVAAGVVVAGLVGGAALRYARRFHGRSDSSSHGATFAGFATLLALMLTATAVSMVASWVL